MGANVQSLESERVRFRILWVCLLLIVQAGALSYVGLTSPPYADEIHYQKTIQEFALNPSLHTLLSYKEVTAPLTFIVYGAWGRLVGTEIAHLRLLSILLAFIFQILLFELLDRFTQSPRRAFLLGLLVVLNPYMIGLNVVVYTDVMALIGLIVTVHATLSRRVWMLLAGSTMALLSRQYMLFIVAAAGLYLVARIISRRDATDRALIVALLISCLPLGALVVGWGGTAPPRGVEHWLRGESTAWHPSYLVAYVAMISVYLFPLIALRWRVVLAERRLWLWSLLFIPLYALAPIEASAITLRLSNYDTIGYVHRFVVSVTGDLSSAHGVLFGLWVLGLPVFIWMARDAWRRRRTPDPRLFLDLAALSFLLVMPLSFHVWEKYLLPVIPVLLCRFAAEDQ